MCPTWSRASNFASYITNDWHLTGIGTLQSGEPYSLYEFYGAVGSINFGNFPTLMNPVLGIKDPKTSEIRVHRQQGLLPRMRAAPTFQPSILRRLPSTTWRPARMAFRPSTGDQRSDRISTRPLSMWASAISSARQLKSVLISPSARASRLRKRSRLNTNSTSST